MFKQFIRPLLFLLQPEKAHYFTVGLLSFLLKIPILGSIFKGINKIENKTLERTVFGLTFKNPVGLAAGFDKNATFINEMDACGFGFIEVGTVTPKPQDGNPKPRLFRLSKNEALINRMGFNNLGVEAMVQQLKNRNKNILVGGNIGKNKVTPNEEALNDYLICFEALHPYVDYFVVNVSSPNTPGLRDLQDKEPLTKILKTLVERNLAFKYQKPILLKIAPDLTDTQLDDIIEIVADSKIDGVIATNTTVDRNNLSYSSAEIEKIGMGGLSGKPVKDKSNYVIAYLHKKSNASFPIIGVGGIHSASDAIEKLNAGASLVQLYTGFVYEGPSLIKAINKAILAQKVA